MEKEAHCKCKKGCESGRCSCLRNNEPCDEACGCHDCRNPLNGVNLDALSICAIQNIATYKALSEAELAAPHELPCGDAQVPLRDLLKGYDCPKCRETWWYSFCWDEVVQEGNSWHCEICKQCRDWREWHCERCNRCTYCVSLPCENCRARGPFQEGDTEDYDDDLFF